MTTTGEVYSGLASFGKAKSVFGLITGIIFFLILMGVGIFLLVLDSKYKTINATVINSVCDISNNKYSCVVEYEYSIRSMNYNKTIIIKDLTSPIINGQINEIQYNSSNIGEIRQKNNSFTIFGWVMIVIAIVILMASIITTIITFLFKPYAAISGASALIPNIGGGGGLINVRTN